MSDLAASPSSQLKGYYCNGLDPTEDDPECVFIEVFSIACIWGWKDKPVAAVESREHGLAELVVILSTFT